MFGKKETQGIDVKTKRRWTTKTGDTDFLVEIDPVYTVTRQYDPGNRKPVSEHATVVDYDEFERRMDRDLHHFKGFRDVPLDRNGVYGYGFDTVEGRRVEVTATTWPESIRCLSPRSGRLFSVLCGPDLCADGVWMLVLGDIDDRNETDHPHIGTIERVRVGRNRYTYDLSLDYLRGIETYPTYNEAYRRAKAVIEDCCNSPGFTRSV